MEGIIYNIQHYSIHDGPGIRTTVFFKGCQLKCPWCANPESQSVKKELGFMSARCKGCGYCAEKCVNKAITMQADKPVTDFSVCSLCGECERNCLNEARLIYGRSISSVQLAEAVASDASFYRESGGGVTVSGGEPTLQPEFLCEFLIELKKKGISTAIETHGCFGKEIRDKIIDSVDCFLIDFKHSDSEKMKTVCGMGNELAKENFKALTQKGKSVIMRIPVIPGFNDTPENMAASATFAAELGVSVCLLPFHSMASVKYSALNRSYSSKGLLPPPAETLEQFISIFDKQGVKAQIGG